MGGFLPKEAVDRIGAVSEHCARESFDKAKNRIGGQECAFERNSPVWDFFLFFFVILADERSTKRNNSVKCQEPGGSPFIVS